MNLSDLRLFVSAAHRPTLGAVALEMHVTPSAVSKALRRLEESLGTTLFDRSARQLALNASGRLLLARAQQLLALADQAKSDLLGEQAAIDCRVGGPAILLWRHGRALADALRAYPEAGLRMQALFEDEALAALARGDVNAAIVTGEVTDGRGEHWSDEWVATPLGGMVQHLVAARGHPLLEALAAGPDGVPQATMAQVLAHDFACPTRSLFCGMQRGARSDGWRDDQLPRKIRYWTDDLQLLLTLVKSCQALAYLPDFALEDAGLVRIHIRGSAFVCSEQVALVWNPMRSGAWQQHLAATLACARPA